MKFKILLSVTLLVFSYTAIGQTLYVPSGTNGVALHFLDSTGTGRSTTYSKTDTFYNQSDIDIKFHWPPDSLVFDRIK